MSKIKYDFSVCVEFFNQINKVDFVNGKGYEGNDKEWHVRRNPGRNYFINGLANASLIDGI